MKMKNLKIGTQLRIGFAAMLLFVFVLGVVSYWQSYQIQQQTEIMYNHPLKITNTIDSLEADIQNMRLGLRELMLANSDKERQDAYQLMALSEADTHQQFDILNKQYLGPHTDIDKAYKSFIRWKTAQEENIKLATSGEIKQVEKNTCSTGTTGIYRKQMMTEISIINNFAEKKAESLYANSIELSNLLNRRLILLIAAILLFTLIINNILLRNIRKPLEEMNEATQRFHKGDMNVRSSYTSKNEFGELSASFNTLADSIQGKSDIDEKFANLAALMLSEYEVKKFFQATINSLASHTGSQMAAIYLLSDDKKTFNYFESIGLSDNARQTFAADSFEGEFGAALFTRKVQLIKNISEDTRFIFYTVSGKIIPQEIITIPILADNEVVAVISLACINKYSNQSIQLIDRILFTLCARVEGILAYHKVKEISEELANSSAYTRNLIEASIDPLVTIGIDGRITDVNKSTEEVTGLTRTELIGTDFADYFTDQALAKAGYKQVFRDGVVRNYELTIRNTNGHLVPVLYNATVYRDEKGKTIGVFAAARDITEQKRAEQELIKLNQELIQRSENLASANQELESQKTELASQSGELMEQNTELEMQKSQLSEASRLKTNFLSNMSHELRTPLNSVIALSGVLNRRLANQIPEEEYSYLDVIERNGKQLLNLINDILDISRIEAGREEIEVTEFNVNNLISEVVGMIHQQAVQKNIQLLHSVGSVEMIISSDADKCRHILQNLIGNAIKFTEKGKVEITVLQNENSINITITDTGIGISKDNLPYIFDEFRQADGSTSRRFGGSGLGLAIAQKYAHLLGGIIAVKSIIEKGSEFTLTLPLHYAAENRISIVETKTDVKHTNKNILHKYNSNLSVKTILLVEDSEPAIVQIKDFLEERGYQILVARDGGEALSIIDQTIPDAMILDLMMPGIDGFEVLRTLRNAEPTAHIPVLILTAKHITKEELKFLKRNNIHQLIQKGDVNRNELLSAISTMVYPEIMETVKPERELQPIVGKPVVLVVEDNADNMITVKALLANNYTVIEAVDGFKGVEMAKKHKPNIILMDIALPDMSGIDAFKAIRNDVHLQHIPVIALTASAMTSDREAILMYGFDAYIAKPIDNIYFFKIINEILYGK